MYVIVHHDIKNPETAFQRGERLMYDDGAPDQVHVLQFYPSQDSTKVTCLFEADSVKSVQTRDETLAEDGMRLHDHDVRDVLGHPRTNLRDPRPGIHCRGPERSGRPSRRRGALSSRNVVMSDPQHAEIARATDG